MSDELELIHQFILDNKDANFHIPQDYAILSHVSNTPIFLRKYFEWKGKKGYG